MDAIVIKVHTDTDPEKPGLTWVTDFMKPRILSPGLERVITTFRFGKDKVGPEKNRCYYTFLIIRTIK